MKTLLLTLGLAFIFSNNNAKAQVLCDASLIDVTTDSTTCGLFIATPVLTPIQDSTLTHQWEIAGRAYDGEYISLQIFPNTYQVSHTVLLNGQACSTYSQMVTVNCQAPAATTICDANFSATTDTSTTMCITFIEGGMAAMPSETISVEWTVDGQPYSGNGFALGLPLNNGAHYVTCSVFDQYGYQCAYKADTFTVNCDTSSSTCIATADFQMFADSTTNGNYFAYNNSYGSGNVSYLWDFGDGNTSTNQYPTHTYLTPGQYVICLDVTAASPTSTCTDTYCDSSSVQRMAAGFVMSQFNVIPQTVTDIHKQEIVSGLKAYPNPFTDTLTLEVATTDNSDVYYTIVDAVGRIALTGKVIGKKINITTNDLDKGFYNLILNNQQGAIVKTIKIIK